MAKNITCPQCCEDIKIYIKNYKIDLFGCKNNHKIYNISLNEFTKTQMINSMNLKCEICKENNEANSDNNEFYKCYECNKIICKSCKLEHDKNHHLINYDKIHYICNKHNEPYTSYCKKCKMNLCTLCEKEHSKHEKKILSEMIINKNELVTKLNELKKAIDSLNDFINKIIEILNTIKDNINNYYKIEEFMINNYEPKETNYEVLYNINEIIHKNNEVINDINQVNNNTNYQKKLDSIINIYYKMDNDKKIKLANIDEISQLILEKELNQMNLETKSYDLQEEAKAKLKAGDRSGAKRTLAKKKLLVEQMQQNEIDLQNLEIQKLELYDIKDLDLNSLEDRVKALVEEAKDKLNHGDNEGAKRILKFKNFFVKKIIDYKNLTKLEDQKEESNNDSDEFNIEDYLVVD